MEKIHNILWKIENIDEYLKFTWNNQNFYFCKKTNKLFIEAKLSFFSDNIFKINLSSDIFFAPFELFEKETFFLNLLKKKKIPQSTDLFWVLKIFSSDYIFSNNLIDLPEKIESNLVFCYEAVDLSCIRFLNKEKKELFFNTIENFQKTKFYFFYYHLGIDNFYCSFNSDLNIKNSIYFFKNVNIYSFFHKINKNTLSFAFFNTNFKEYYFVQRSCDFFNFLENIFIIYNLIFYNKIKLKNFFTSSTKKGYIYYLSDKEVENFFISLWNFILFKKNIENKNFYFNQKDFEKNFINLSNYLVNFKSMSTFSEIDLINSFLLKNSKKYFRRSTTLIAFFYLYYWTKLKIKYELINNAKFNIENKAFFLFKSFLSEISITSNFKENLIIWYFWSKSIRNLIVHFDDFSKNFKSFSFFCNSAIKNFQSYYKNFNNKNIELVTEFWKKILKRDNFFIIFKEISDIFYFQVYLLVIFIWILICNEANINFDIFLLIDFKTILNYINNNKEQVSFQFFYERLF
ncbi:hypothetical protein JTY60_01940 [symbiont of Argiope bruennichi]|uniref:hypothetical protein n=1 Tax=symbiont of Argiope bruennichi TaxID=2810479 RepID=UPI003DA5CB70